MKPVVQQIWNLILRECNMLYDKTGIKIINNIYKDLKIKLSLYPYVSSGYYSESNHIQFNPLTLYFSLIQLNPPIVIFSPRIQQAGVLLHELDHLLYFKEYNMIGIKGDEKDSFDKEHRRDSEERAYKKQLAFYNKCLKILPEKYPIAFLTKDMISDKYSRIKSSYRKTEDIINGFIEHIQKNVLPRLETDIDDYLQSAEKDDIVHIECLVKYFSGNIDKNKEEIDYESIELLC